MLSDCLMTASIADDNRTRLVKWAIFRKHLPIPLTCTARLVMKHGEGLNSCLDRLSVNQCQNLKRPIKDASH